VDGTVNYFTGISAPVCVVFDPRIVADHATAHEIREIRREVTMLEQWIDKVEVLRFRRPR